jgi:hypothetical protein
MSTPAAAAPEKKSSALKEVVTRDHTIHLHKALFGW